MKTILTVLIAASLVLTACSSSPPQSSLADSSDTQSPSNQADSPLWKTATLVDVRTDTSFTIADFSNKPVLIEMFAVWCPNCLRQQNEMKKLHEEVGDEIEFIAIDVDPNEAAEKIRSHALTNGFRSRYVVNPPEVTQSLLSEFGPTIASAPGTPVILVCPDGSSRLLASGVKSAEKLKSEVAAGC